MNRNRNLVLGAVLLVLVTAAITFLASGVFYSGNNFLQPSPQGLTFDPKTVGAENIEKFNDVKGLLEKNFYQDVDEKALLEGATAGMTDALKDPYTVYFTKEQMKSFTEKSEGSYVGIGVSIITDNNGILSVIEPFEDSPAKKAGLLQGDKIVKVDDTDVTGYRDENMVISMIKGQEDTKVKITVYRPSEGKYIDFDLVRKRIKIVNIKSEVLPGNIGYIKLIMFDTDIAKYFEEHLQKLMAQNIKGLIIDLRDNPGGALDQVVKIADRILPEGLIVYTEDRNKKRIEEKSDKTELNLPLAVLINGNSASASEILAGAIKDHEKGTLVGTKTFGKGVVQAVIPLRDGSGLKVTVSRYFTPSGVCIQGIGIEPNVKVELPENLRSLPASQVKAGDDSQLKTAEEILKAKVK